MTAAGLGTGHVPGPGGGEDAEDQRDAGLVHRPLKGHGFALHGRGRGQILKRVGAQRWIPASHHLAIPPSRQIIAQLRHSCGRAAPMMYSRGQRGQKMGGLAMALLLSSTNFTHEG